MARKWIERKHDYVYPVQFAGPSSANWAAIGLSQHFRVATTIQKVADSGFPGCYVVTTCNDVPCNPDTDIVAWGSIER